jgi:hypothetical protein
VGETFASITYTGTGHGYDFINVNGMTVGNITDSSTSSVGYNLIEGTVNRGMVSTAMTGNPNSDLVINTLSGVSNNLSLSYFKAAELDSPTDITVGAGVQINAISGSGNITVTGTLDLNGGPSGAQITIANGGTLKGSGTISGSDITVQSGGVIAPGHSPGCLTTPTFNLNGTYQAEIGGPTACSQYDQVTASSSVVITNGTLQPSLINGFIPTAGQVFTVINNTSANPISGVFTNLPEGSTISASGYDFKLSYVGGDGNDMTLTTIGPSASSSGGGAGSGNSSAPGTPHTGLGALTANPLVAAFTSLAGAGTIAAIARRLRPQASQEQ